MLQPHFAEGSFGDSSSSGEFVDLTTPSSPELRHSRGPFATETYQAFVFIHAPPAMPFRTVSVVPVPPPPPPLPIPPLQSTDAVSPNNEASTAAPVTSSSAQDNAANKSPTTTSAGATGTSTVDSDQHGTPTHQQHQPQEDNEPDEAILSLKPVARVIESRLTSYIGRPCQLMLVPCLARGKWSITLAIQRRLLREAFLTNSSTEVHFEFEVSIMDGPFRGADYSASCITGRHYTAFTSDIYFFDLTFSRMPLEWAFLRYSVRSMPLNAWAFFLRNSQTMFPRTDKETSIASQPFLMLSPNPHERFCFDLRKSSPDAPLDNHLYHGYVRDGVTAEAEAALKSKARSRFAKDMAMRLDRIGRCYITINRDFRATLLRMREYHKMKPHGTWFDLDYIAFLSSVQASDGFNFATPSRSSLGSSPLALLVFELWDSTTHEPLASTYGFQVGAAYHDCSMATFYRDRSLVGSLLSHAVADVLQRAGVRLWYWGKELPYMTDYRRTAKAFTVSSSDFFPMWRAAAQHVPSEGDSVAAFFDAQHANHAPHFRLASPYTRQLIPPPARMSMTMTYYTQGPLPEGAVDGDGQMQTVIAVNVTKPLELVNDAETVVAVAFDVAGLLPPLATVPR